MDHGECQRCKAFQLTSSRGGWPACSRALFWPRRYFNSHPHEEDDYQDTDPSVNWDISTHILTRRMTSISDSQPTIRNISTHILTRRMTLPVLSESYSLYISTHILTRRMTLLQYYKENTLWFQLTSSQGGWRSRSKILIRRNPFQLTSSQGGWLPRRSRRLSVSYFNSHPHKEDDRTLQRNQQCIIISTHILTRRMTISTVKMQLNRQYFNSHPHKEDDQPQDTRTAEGVHFNSHPHKEDDSNFKQK